MQRVMRADSETIWGNERKGSGSGNGSGHGAWGMGLGMGMGLGPGNKGATPEMGKGEEGEGQGPLPAIQSAPPSPVCVRQSWRAPTSFPAPRPTLAFQNWNILLHLRGASTASCSVVSPSQPRAKPGQAKAKHHQLTTLCMSSCCLSVCTVL